MKQYLKGYPIISDYVVTKGKKEIGVFANYVQALQCMRANWGSIITYKISVPHREVLEIRARRAKTNGY